MPSSERRRILFQGNELGIEVEVYRRGTRDLATRKLAYQFAGHEFKLEAQRTKETAYGLSVSPSSKLRLRRMKGRPWDLPGPIKSYAFPDQIRTYYQNAVFLSDLELQYEEQIDRVYYLGPLRDYPRREYQWSGSRPLGVGHRGERAVDAILASQVDGEKIGRGRGKRQFTVEEYVAYWLKELGLIHNFTIKEIAPGTRLYRVKVKKFASSPEVLITDVGFGVSQLLPVLVLLYYVPAGSTVLLEQPEIHLHPAVQSGLADVLIDAYKVKGIQTIVESHSEHLLRRLQRRMAEEELDPEKDIALYFCELRKGTSKLTTLELDLFGNIQNWPEGFFGDEFGEIAAMQQTILERKRKATE